MDGDPDLAAIAGVIGDPARAAMLLALLDGRALPAGELAREARIAPSTASGHLARLAAAGLVVVERHGRHRHHRLAGAEVADAIEALSALAPPRAVKSLRAADRTVAERAARSCYDHLAGALGVAVTDRLCQLGALDRDSLALRDGARFEPLGIDVAELPAGRRPVTRACLDWSERRHHLAGALGAALLDALLSRGWLVRRPLGRALAVTPAGASGLHAALGVDLPAAR